MCGLIAILFTILELKFTCRECVWVIYYYFARNYAIPSHLVSLSQTLVSHIYMWHADLAWLHFHGLFRDITFSFLPFFSLFFWWLGGLVVFEISHRLLGFRVVKFLYDNVCIKNGCKTCMFKLGWVKCWRAALSFAQLEILLEWNSKSGREFMWLLLDDRLSEISGHWILILLEADMCWSLTFI